MTDALNIYLRAKTILLFKMLILFLKTNSFNHIVVFILNYYCHFKLALFLLCLY